ncbi:MAG TPA: acyl carrier protein [Dehalococcoidia bacterium]|nr:acyl carrier protein [Dehalococcoidia bacterium]
MDPFEEVKKAICKVNPGIEEQKVVLNASLKDDLDIDSLDLVEVALALEDAFGFALPEDDLDEIVTVGDIVSLIERMLKVQSA